MHPKRNGSVVPQVIATEGSNLPPAPSTLQILKQSFCRTTNERELNQRGRAATQCEPPALRRGFGRQADGLGWTKNFSTEARQDREDAAG